MMSVTRKLLLGISGAMVLVLLGSTLCALAVMRSLADRVAEEMMERKLVGDAHAARLYLEKHFGELRLVDGHLVDRQGQGIEDRYAMVDAIREDLGGTATIFIKDGEDYRRLVTNVKKPDGTRAVGTWLGKASAAYPEVSAGREYRGRADILGKPYLTCYQPLTDSVGSVIGILYIGLPLADLHAWIDQDVARSGWLLAALGLALAAATGVVLSLLARRMLRRAIASLRHVVDADGDLTRRLDVDSADEVGELARLFNSFMDRLEDSLARIRRAAGVLTTHSDSLSAACARIARSAENIEDQSSTVSSAADQASRNVEAIASSAGEVSAEIQAVASSIEEMSSTIAEVSRSCQQEAKIADQATRQAQTTRRLVGNLAETSKEIEKILDLIGNIAGQTRLLALNATIEAAAAGAAGKGFAVVAGEVKELARQTSTAASDIAGQVERMRQDMSESSHSIEAIAAVIAEVDAISGSIAGAVEEQSSAVREVARSIEGASGSSSRIAGKVTESASGLSAMTETLKRVDGECRATAQSIRAISGNAAELAQLAGDLHRVVGAFRIGDQENAEARRGMDEDAGWGAGRAGGRSRKDSSRQDSPERSVLAGA